MANYDHPVSSGLEAAEAMRALAHATLKFDDKPEETFDVLGDMLSITSSYVSVLSNVADAHVRNIEAAHDDQGRDRDAGRVLGLAAAQSLRRAAFQIADAYRHIDDATQMSSRIVWIPDAPPGRASHEPHRATRHQEAVPRAAGTTGVSQPRSAPWSPDHASTRPEGLAL